MFWVVAAKPNRSSRLLLAALIAKVYSTRVWNLRLPAGTGQEIVHQRCALEMGGVGMYFTVFTFK
ncbi:hypothetical protein [Haliscomenobacter sp.]|uniref:hypothetical protein n=1 Tax=Haliscomenobacter sp. TaxID=2717303 RepID=UPI003BAA2260